MISSMCCPPKYNAGIGNVQSFFNNLENKFITGCNYNSKNFLRSSCLKKKEIERAQIYKANP